MSQAELAGAAGISPGPIKAIETEGRVPKASTLQQIANGLASYGGDRLDEDLAASYYNRLMEAAGLLPSRASLEAQPRRAVEDLTDEEVDAALARRFDDEHASMAFLAQAKNWRDRSPAAKRFILNSFQMADQIDAEVEAAERRDAQRRPRS